MTAAPRKRTPAAKPAASKSDDLEVTIQVNEFTLGEIDKIEELAGMGIGMIDDRASPKAKLVRAMVTVMVQRTDPAFTFEQAGEYKFNWATAQVFPPTGESD